MHPLYSIPNFVTSALTISLGLFVFLKRPNEPINRLFGLLTWSVAHWLLGYALVYCTTDPVKALTYARFAYIGVVFIPTFFLHFMDEFLQLNQRFLLIFAYAISFLFLYIIQLNVFMNGVYSYFWGYYPKAGPLYWTWLVYFYAAFGLCDFKFTRAYFVQRTSDQNSLRAKQLKYVLWANCVASLSFMDYLPNFGLQIYPCAYLAAFGWLVLMAYAIAKHHLLDINVLIRRTLIYSAVTAVLTSVYLLIALGLARAMTGWVASPTAFSSAVAACAMALLFHPLRMKIQRFVDRYFFRESLDQAILREATSGFVHEIKRPLAKIGMPAELSLADLQELSDGKRSVQEVLPSVMQRLRYIVNETIDAGDKIEAIHEVSSADVKPMEDVDLKDVIKNSLEREKELIDRHHIQAHINLPKYLPSIHGHAKQLEIVISNLIKNAAEALSAMSLEAPRAIWIGASTEDGYISLSVRDSGPGIKAENLKRLFEPYFTTKGAHGTGMGLFLCRQIVQGHGGVISANASRNGTGGMEFVISLPNNK
jgi:signal transduction histidine kinase